MRAIQQMLSSAVVVMSVAGVSFAQAPPAAPPRTVLSVSSPTWPDGGEVPLVHSMRGANKSPAFEFHWTQGNTAVAAPEALRTYAIILHDMEGASNKGPSDTFHWAVFNIPGTAKGLPEGLPPGDLPDGTRNGPGIASREGKPPSYFGPGAGPGPFHHYVFEVYALDTKLDLPANTTREEILKAIDGHIIGKAAYFGRFHAAP